MGTYMKGDENMSKRWKVGSCLGVLVLLAASLAMAAPSGVTKADLEQKALLHKSVVLQQKAVQIEARKVTVESSKAAAAKLTAERKVMMTEQRALFAQMKTNRDPALRKQFIANQHKLMSTAASRKSLKGGR